MFMGGKCYDLNGELVIDCVKEALSEVGLRVTSLSLYNLDGNEVSDINNARYLRVETQGDIPGRHIFTFAIIKVRDRFRVLYLQSAIS